MKIIWSEPAKKDYWQNIDYLLKDWNEKVAINFIKKVEQAIYFISQNPTIFQKTNYKEIRYITIVPQITLYYQINNDTVEIVRLWNNYQQPENLNCKKKTQLSLRSG